MKNNIVFDHKQVSQAIHDCLPQQPLQHKLTVGIIALGLALSVLNPVKADTFTVINTNDSGPGSFLQAVLDAENNPGSDTINMSSVSGEINSAAALIEIYDSVDIVGPGRDLLSISRPISVIGESYSTSNINVSITGLGIKVIDIEGGYESSALPLLTISNSYASRIGAYDADVKISNTTISGVNSTQASGVDLFGDGLFEIKDSIIQGGDAGVTIQGDSYAGVGRFLIQDSVISSNTIGLRATQSLQYLNSEPLVIDIERCTISGNQTAVQFDIGSSVNITETDITGNSKGLIGAGNLSLVESTISETSGDGVKLLANSYDYSASKFEIVRSTISRNTGTGVIIDSYAATTGVGLVDSTVSQNGNTGFVHYGSNGIDILGSTITGNNGGVINSPVFNGIDDPDLKIVNSIVAGNSAAGKLDLDGDRQAILIHSLIGTIGAAGFEDQSPESNLIGKDPLLGPLADNGGLTQTHALLSNSRAIDAGNNTNCTATDQRGVDRPQRFGCDIGAYELNGTSGTPVSLLGDYVWQDINGDGIQDGNEPGVQNVTVELQNCSGNPLDTTTTDANGAYVFTGMTDGEYQVQFQLPPNQVFTTQESTSDSQLDSDANVTTGQTECYALTAGENRADIDAGLIATIPVGTGIMGNFVWSDRNGDGVFSSGDESGLADVSINLRTCDGSLLDTTTSDAEGGYTFSGLNAGTYRLQFHLPSDYSFSPAKAGTDYQLDSNINPATGLTQCYTMADGQMRLAIDAGMVPEPASVPDTLAISHAIYFDEDNKLWIRVESDATPIGSSSITATMVVNGVEIDLGNIGWKADIGFYQQVFENITVQPDSIILTSEQGGIVSGLVRGE